MNTTGESLRQLRDSEAIRAALDQIDSLWVGELGKYVARLPPLGQTLSAKSIKDSVWGMIHLEGYEVLVVDSPPFQRMRRVKQLGTTFLTFPTADYSRFEHALGVMHQATRMVSAIAERSGNGESIRKAQRCIRLACLLHDIGHLPMSHVIERHFGDFPDPAFQAAHQDIEAILEVECQLSEVISFLLIQSKTFRRFLVEHCGYSDLDIDSATLAILGVPPKERPFIKQLISNVIDADKLDYMFRDSRYTSVPLPVDLDRLLFKLKLLPESAELEGRSKAGYLAIDLGGAHLIEDLIIARRILARQIYRHHKTLAAEQLILGVLAQVRPPLLSLASRDDTFLIAEGAGGSGILSLCEDGQRDAAHAEIEDFRYRRLPKRAFARSFSLLERQYDKDGKSQVVESQKRFELKLAEDLQLQGKRSELEAKTLMHFNEIAGLLDQHRDGVKRIYFDGSTGPKPPEAELFVQRPDQTFQLYEAFAAQAAAFAHSPEEFNYVFYSGNPAAVALVHIAVERTLYDAYGLRYTRGCADHAKINFIEVEAYKHAIEARCPTFFDHCRALRPSSVIARRDKGKRVSDLAQRFKKYGAAAMDKDLLRFIDQFPDTLVPGLLEVLEKIQFIEDTTAAERLKQSLDEMDLKDSALVPLTKIGESSSVMAYHLRARGAKVCSLEDARKRGQKIKRVIFFEDSLLSGKQATSVLLSQFGKEAPSPSDAVAELPTATQNWLKKVEIGFLFSVVADEGANALATCCDSLGLRLAKRGGKPLIRAGMGPSATYPAGRHENLRVFLTEVGESLLLANKQKSNPEKWNNELCKSRAFGYSGNGGLTVFQNNSPTSSITALWCAGGQYKGREWYPLFPRRDPETMAESKPDDKQSVVA